MAVREGDVIRERNRESLQNKKNTLLKVCDRAVEAVWFGSCSYRFWLSLTPSLNGSGGAALMLPWGLKVKPNAAWL